MTEISSSWLSDESGKDPVDVALLCVTHRSSELLSGLATSLESGLQGITSRSVVVDSGSADDTVANVRRLLPAADVIALADNVGFAAAINAGLRRIGRSGGASSVLIVNPDIRLHTNAAQRLYAAMNSQRAGIVVPRLVDEFGQLQFSLRRRPRVSATWCEAILGAPRAHKLGLPVEVIRDPARYAVAGLASWATGGCMLVSAATLVAVGEWDERYFMYEEEVDFCLRAADRGHSVHYEPGAEVTRIVGEPMPPPWAEALIQCNRVEHLRKRGCAGGARLTKLGLIAGDVIRLVRGRRQVQPALVSLIAQRTPAQIVDLYFPVARALVSSLPPASSVKLNGLSPRAGAPAASVIIPAHNEEQVIATTLMSLLDPPETERLEIVVVCNGCSDQTASIARAASPDVTVIEIDEASKSLALAVGNRVATTVPRLYLDADVQLDARSAQALIDAVREPFIDAAGPRRVLARAGVSPLVRCYYDVWEQLPQVRSGLFGRGVIALSRAGWETASRLPSAMSDDLAISESISRHRRVVVSSATVTVQPPRTMADLIRRRIRVTTGNAQADQLHLRGKASRTSLGSLGLVVIRAPRLMIRLPIFAAVSIFCRLAARPAVRARDFQTWLRDDSSRQALP
jgi:GT2 family glycosyltransferase